MADETTKDAASPFTDEAATPFETKPFTPPPPRFGETQITFSLVCIMAALDVLMVRARITEEELMAAVEVRCKDLGIQAPMRVEPQP